MSSPAKSLATGTLVVASLASAQAQEKQQMDIVEYILPTDAQTSKDPTVRKNYVDLVDYLGPEEIASLLKAGLSNFRISTMDIAQSNESKYKVKTISARQKIELTHPDGKVKELRMADFKSLSIDMDDDGQFTGDEKNRQQQYQLSSDASQKNNTHKVVEVNFMMNNVLQPTYYLKIATLNSTTQEVIAYYDVENVPLRAISEKKGLEAQSKEARDIFYKVAEGMKKNQDFFLPLHLIYPLNVYKMPEKTVAPAN